MIRRKIIAILGLIALALVLSPRPPQMGPDLPPEGTLRCVLPLQDADFQRNLIRKYAQDLQLDMHFVSCDAPVDSLKSGAVDLVVLSAAPDRDDIALSRPFADGSVWAVRSDETEGLRRINRWITELTASERFNRMQRQYLSGKKVSLTAISPYDGMIKAQADSIGWDWRLLAAVIYNESRFNNDVSSLRGALGLMQIRSSRYSTDQLLNPATNLSIGSRYLKKLEKMFSADAATPFEAVKFALAAYNAGEGRILQAMESADAQGRDTSRWDNVAQALPEGHHTPVYVEKVLDTYAYYSRLYPR